eukprot:c1949_g1_i1.p1 GENE.c1949_g1_i1~~c1949_g1_i1.p1  ORF type:complete len:140 (+),score=46.10 c1949_g1_i1:59-478(+)
MFFPECFSRAVCGRASRGLYHGRTIGFGNNVSHSERRTRRSWKPNVHSKNLWSDIYQKFLHFNVTTHALRCIDKAGGLDGYLLTTPDHVVGNPKAAIIKKEMNEMIKSGKVLHPYERAKRMSEQVRLSEQEKKAASGVV